VKKGGKLIVTQSAWGSPLDPRVLQLAGVTGTTRRPLDYGYVGTTPPLLLRGSFAHIAASPGTTTLYSYVPPLSAGDGGKKFGHGHAPPTVPDGQPVVTLRPLGQGQVLYIALPFFKAYFDHQNPSQAWLFLDLLDRVLPDPLVKVDTRAQVELSVMRRGADLVIHLVNHSGRERLGNYWYPVTEYIPEIRDIAVSIRAPRGSLAVQCVPDQTALPTQLRDGYLHAIVPRLHVMQSLCVPGYFEQNRPAR
jgi:hypothetical protein